MSEYTTIQVEKPTANKLRKAAIDTGDEIRELATRVIEKGLRAVRDENRTSDRNNTTTP
jgi:hypothetical protein